jgi:hypothetical protein
MTATTFRNNDALRLEFIRSVIRNAPGEGDESLAVNLLFAFMKGSARVTFRSEDEVALRVWLCDVVGAHQAIEADTETLIHDIAALAAQVADSEASLTSLLPAKDHIAGKTL